ncbi:MAG TPA: inorganic diphosphatase [Kofleriaceae bacterium]|nr:inorganic diphosphatase [Kofleriaceae bacterium]
MTIETPAGCRTKYAWDPDKRAYLVSKILPAGMVFPYDFGFVPETKADDGDPLDAMVIADEPLLLGTVVECRVLAVLEIKTSDPDSNEVTRNDRVIVVPVASVRGSAWNDLGDIAPIVDEITEFFHTYITHEGRRFELVGKRGRVEALAVVTKSAR